MNTDVTITITLNEAQVKTLKDALKVNGDALQAEANCCPRNGKRCGITRKGWQALANDNKNLWLRLTHEWAHANGRTSSEPQIAGIGSGGAA